MVQFIKIFFIFGAVGILTFYTVYLIVRQLPDLAVLIGACDLVAICEMVDIWQHG
jgi:hypothetical protein